MELDALVEALDALCEVDPATVADTESIEVLQRQLARLDALVTQATAAFDTAGNWVPDGARNAAAWLTWRCRLPRGEARRQVRRGRALSHLGASRTAWVAGDITGAHLDVMAGLRSEVTSESLERDEQLLVNQAGDLSFQGFVRATSYWRQLADPDGEAGDAEAARAGRDVYLAQSYQGMWLGQMTLDPISGSIVAGELERLEQALFAADWQEAEASLGRRPLHAELARTSAQRRADALVEMATRSKIAPRGGRYPAPLFTVLVGWETLHGRVCELGDGTVIPPSVLTDWLDVAELERAVFTPPRRVEIGARTRLFTGAARRALEVRDRQCAHDTCEVPSAACQADHILPFAMGGPTTQDNGRMLCGFHNRLRNQRPPPDG